MPDSRHPAAVDDPEFQPEVPAGESELEPEPQPALPFAATPLGRTLTYVSLAFVAGMLGGVMGAALVAPHWAYKAREPLPKVLDVEGVNASWLAVRDRYGNSRLYLGLNDSGQAELNMTGPEANAGLVAQVDERGHGRMALYNGKNKAVELTSLANGEQGLSVYSDTGEVLADLTATDGVHGSVSVYGGPAEGGANLRVTSEGLPVLNLYDGKGADVFRVPSEPQPR